MDGGGSAKYNPRTVEEVFRDYKGRRAGMIRALTTDVDDFYQQCDPEKENLCLYGFPNENWEVALPAEEVPPELPEPALGINFARDGMQEKDWLSLVAVHSDAWLLAVAFYFGARFGFDKAERGYRSLLLTSTQRLSSSSRTRMMLKFQQKRKEMKMEQQQRMGKRTTGRLSAVPVEITMRPMSSGSAATSARSGSTENVSRSHLRVPSTSSSTSARPAAPAANVLGLCEVKCKKGLLGEQVGQICASNSDACNNVVFVVSV